jgi:GMP synthase-like glutamine amidotransferase
VPICLVIQHVAPEGAFAIGDALDAEGIEVTTCRVFAGDALPSDLKGLDGLVIMGGPMSANSDDGFASRPTEMARITEALASGLPTLGVCLGAQLLALAGGGTVRPGPAGPEIGWGPVELTDECTSDHLFADLPGTLGVLQWHGDTFDLPPGAVHLAANAAYKNQAFRVGPAAWGLQFHVEVDAGAVAGFLAAFGADAEGVPGGPEAISAATPAALARLTPSRNLLLTRFAQLVAANVTRPDLVGS